MKWWRFLPFVHRFSSDEWGGRLKGWFAVCPPTNFDVYQLFMSVSLVHCFYFKNLSFASRFFKFIASHTGKQLHKKSTKNSHFICNWEWGMEILRGWVWEEVCGWSTDFSTALIVILWGVCCKNFSTNYLTSERLLSWLPSVGMSLV